MGQMAAQRNAVFAESIDEYLDAITEGTHVEVANYVVNTRRALDLTMHLVQMEGAPETPTPPVTPTTPATPEPSDTPNPPTNPADRSDKILLPFIER